MMDTNIPHLHTHTYFSALDGVPSPESYLKRCDELRIPAIAFTDHGNCGSWAQASIESKNYRAKPILGIEAYVSKNVDKINSVRKMEREEKDESKKQKYKDYLKKNRPTFHIILLAKNKSGYDNIVSINNHAWTDGFYYRSRTDLSHLEKHRSGIISLSACQSGIVSKYILNNQRQKAIAIAKKMKSIYKNDFYLELQFLDMPIQDKLNKELVVLGKAYNIPFVITNDCHYLNNGDHILQQVLIDMMTKKGQERFKIDSKVNYLKTLKDFEDDLKLHKSIPKKIFHQAIDNVFKIAEECNYNVETGNLHFPSYDHTTHFLYSQFPIKEKIEFFKSILLHRAKKILGTKVRDPLYRERIIREFRVLRSIDKNLGGIDYFLIVDDLLNYVRENGAFSVIRGSANGSLIAFVFGFGLIDPVRHNIMFERFISEYRSLNDIDIDIDVRSEFRGKAIEYLKRKYGSDRVISVGTYNRMQLKGAIKDVTRVFKERIDRSVKKAKTQEKIDNLTERQKQFLFPIINRVTSPMEGDLDVKTARRNHQLFNEWYGENEKIMKKYIEPIIGNIKNISLHPAGVIITPGSVDKLLPIRTQVDPHSPSKDRIVATVWENSHTGREDLNEIGVMALDVLGVKTLSVISDVIDLVKETKGIDIDLYNLDLEDKKTLNMFNKGEVTGVFQFSGKAAKQIVHATKITEFNDLIVINALARPGALQAGADKLYAERKEDSSLIRYDHSSLKKVLNDSLGVLVFSEHILKTASEFAGMSPEKADGLRKIIKGKHPKLFAEYKNEFIEGAKRKWKKDKNINLVAEGVWRKFKEAGSYLFPRGHASSYALIGYICMYLKVHYPVEFFTCHLRYATHSEYSDIKAIAESVYGLKFLLPNINKPKSQFEPGKKKKIWWSITALKGIGPKAIESLMAEAPFNSIEDFHDRIDKRVCNLRIVEKLVLAGAFKNFGKMGDVMHEYMEIRKTKGKVKWDGNLPMSFSSKESKILTREDIFGFGSDIIYNLYKDKLDRFGKFTSYDEFILMRKGDRVKVFGKVVKLYKTKTKAGDEMAFSALENGKVTYNITLFPEAYQLAKDYVKENNILVVSGVKNIWNKESSIVLETVRGQGTLGFKSKNWIKKL